MITRCGFVAVAGEPNAGKSTLLNRLTGAKLSIVTPKAQTTRFRVLGILMRGESQVLLVDTPGIFTPRRRLDRAMVAAAWTGVKDADLTLLLVDAKASATDTVRQIAARLAEQKRRSWLVLNKIDLVPAPKLLPLTAALTALASFEQTFMVSAATGDGVEQLTDALAAAVPEGPHLYPDDDLTDLPDRLLAAEIVREQIFLQTHEEVPYGTTVETENWQERTDGSVRIEATVYVARPGHKAILIGEGGQRIKTIGAKAREQLATLLERKVHLFLNVKHRAGWDEEAARLRAIGLQDPGQRRPEAAGISAEMESRVALLERIARTTAASLERIERRLETMDGRFTGRESPFTAIDRGLEAFAPEHRAPFRWLMGIMLGGFGAMLGVMALGFHWL